MRAAYVWRFDPQKPLAGLAIGDRPKPVPPPGWILVEVVAASVNHHDLWSLRGGDALRKRGGAGLGLSDLPRILGTDAAGITQDGREVIVYPLIGPDGAGPPDPSLFGAAGLSGHYDGTLAQFVAVPEANLIPKPKSLSFEQAACLPTAWLTAYRMLFEKAALPPGGTVLIQGGRGALATALVLLGKAAGFRVWVTGRSATSREYALQQGADAAFEMGARLPERVHAVMDSIGSATWPHSLKCLRHSGTMVVVGGTAGYSGEVDIARLFTMNLRIVGTAMGSYRQLQELVDFCTQYHLAPPIDRVASLKEVDSVLEALHRGDLLSKAVITLV
jgi:NADPH:quinone reductase-like Zn-dependent oxidoreductase